MGIQGASFTRYGLLIGGHSGLCAGRVGRFWILVLLVVYSSCSGRFGGFARGFVSFAN